MLKVLVGQMSAEEAFAYLSRKTGAIIRHVELPTKTAALSVATRASFAHSELESENL